MNVGSLLTANAARFPDRVALIEHERKVSYDELNNRVNKLGNKLLALNVRKGDKVSLYLSSSVAWAEIYFALSKIGAVVVPVNSRIKGNELVHIVKNSDSTLLFFDSALKDNVDSVRVALQGTKQFVLLGDNPSHSYILYKELFDEGSQNEPDVSVSGEDVHSICYTSGTTGSPRGAVLTNLNIVIGHYFMCTAEFYVNHDDIFLATTPLSQRIGWGKLINSVALGCTLVIMPSFNAEEAMKIVEREKVTIMSIIPTIGRLILQLPHIESYDTSSLKMLFVTGEACPVEVKNGLTEKFPHVRFVG